MLQLTKFSRVAALGAVLAFTISCEQTRDVLVAPLPPTPTNASFASYVAIGNSITAGFQSNGINDSTQQQSYARLLARAMNTTYRYPSLAMPGCGAPIANTTTGALVTTGIPTGTAALPCYGRTSAVDTSEVLNNVAIPGARVLDPSSNSTVASNTLTQIILKGKSQVQQALRAKPTFASIWIGNNDVLQAGLTGILVPVAGLSPGIVSTQVQFQSSFDAITTPLVAGASGLKGVLIGVAKVQNLPSMVSGALIASNPIVAAPSTRISNVLQLATGTAVTVNANCSGSASLISLPLLVQAIRRFVANNADPLGHPPTISCNPVGPGLVGNIYVLDANEQTTLNAAIDGYNGYIAAKATALNFAYYDPNVLFAAKRANGEIPPFPNFGSTTATFGALISLDGIHPSAAAHTLIAKDLATAINAKYGTTLVVP